jgi:hypothetical protein
MPTTMTSPPVSTSTISKSFSTTRDYLALPMEFRMHGLRVLSSSTMALSMPMEQIERAGAWVSDAVWEAYIEPTLQDRVAGSKAISRYATSVRRPPPAAAGAAGGRAPFGASRPEPGCARPERPWLAAAIPAAEPGKNCNMVLGPKFVLS